MIDIKMSLTGDIVVGPDGDFEFVRTDDYIIQTMMFRLKTTRGDWILAPQIGADLESFIGMRSSEETLAAIKRSVETELSKIPGVPIFDVSVAPKQPNSVWILIEFESLETPEQQLSLIFELDLKTGEVNARE